MVRAHDHGGSNASFEILSQRLAGVQAQVNSMAGMMGNMEQQTDITIASPSIPFKIDEEKRNDGIYIMVSMVIPGNAARVNITLVSVFQNTAQGGESTAQSIARAKAHLQEFTVKCTDNERASNLCIQYIGPLQPKDNPLKNQYHLVLLEVKSKGEKALTPNPMDDPFATFPFQVFKVRNDGANDTENTYFTTGDTSIGKKPSKPDRALIVMNDVNLETQAADATLQFKIFAAVDTNGNPDMTTTFADLDINECYVSLRLFSQTPDTGGDTTEPLRPGGPIADKTKPFTIVEIVLPLAKRYLWIANITKNASGKERNTPGTPVDFYAGGDIGATGLPEFSGGTGMMGGLFTIAAVQLDNAHTELQFRIKQRGAMFPAILLKRIEISKTLPSGVKKTPDAIKLLDQEAVFARTADVTLVREIKHVANKTGIRYDAVLIGVGHTVAAPIQRDAAPAMADSTFSIAPSAPSASLFMTAPDSDTDEANDSYADFTIFASATDNARTFADTGANIVYVVLRKFSGGTLNDDDPTDNRLPKYPFPIEDLNVTNVTCRVRGLKTGRQYVWQRNISERQGSIVKSVSGTTFTFRAGQMMIDPANVGISIVSISQQGTSFLVKVRIVQTTPPTLVRSVSLFKDKNDGMGFLEIDTSKVRIKDKPAFQVAGSTNDLLIEINALKNTTVQLRARVTAVGGLTKDSTAVPGVATGGTPPTMLPSFPMTADIVLNTFSGDISSGTALVVFRLYASWMRGTTGVGGTGPGGSISFNDVAADAAAVTIVDGTTFTNPTMYDAANFDPTQNFTDVAAELTLGKPYAYRRNITYREGVPAKSQILDIPFTAGLRLGTNGLPEIRPPNTALDPFVTLTQVLDGNGAVDNKQVDAQLTFIQPASAVGIKKIIFQRKRAADPAYKDVIGEPLIDDPSYQTAGTKTISRNIQVPANSTFNIRALIIGLGDSASIPVRYTTAAQNAVMPADSGFADTARPQWGGAPASGQSTLSTTVPMMRVRFANNGTIKIKANLPDRQVKTLITCRAAFEFIIALPAIGTRIYTWNPETGAFFQGQASVSQIDFGSGGNPSVSRFDPSYYIDIGKGINAVFSVDKPTISGAQGSATLTSNGDIPSTIVNDLLTAYNAFMLRYLQVRVVVINGFNPTSEQLSSIGVLCNPSTINFPFTGTDRGPASDFFTYLP